MISKKKKLGWRILCALFVIVSVITFTPWVIPMNTHLPKIFGVPYTLGVGFIVAIFFVILTYLGTLFYPGSEEEDKV